MIKLTYLREEDYWLFPLNIFSIFGLVAMLYASMPSYRLPAALIGLGLLLFTTIKVKNGYDTAHAWIHAGVCIGLAIILFIGVFSLTN